ncbi:putative metallocarboxypeptidase ecm14 [Neophaeococcomyces mojaviensis]|uniref:Metallocarboxypeptidase ecm14 n=1 Tax=Neophaeococcomyces mojaviensis TaxID=3383035 RepID=A0ACC2ZVR4_9EURO|nr:putative metallocarboxypeptidase ecm14 [Knufia sp. JES_112]
MSCVFKEFAEEVDHGLIETIWPYYKPSPLSKCSKPQAVLPSKYHSRYGDDVVLRFKIKTEEEALAFAEAADTLYLDVWEASKDWADVRISKKVLPSFLTLLPSSMQQSHTPVITQLSQAVYESYPAPSSNDYGRHRLGKDMPHDLFFENYQPLSVIYPWLRQLASMFPDHTQLFTIGTSFEGRDIPAIRIGTRANSEDSSDDGPRHTIVITAGSHAREWISTSTAAYLLRSLIHNFDPVHQPLIGKLLSHYDFIFVPVLNPDGYEYTWTTDRLWRKNRQETALPFCRGIDLDRSFPYSWDGDYQRDNPCSESYAGEHPLQAVEAQRLTSWAKNETESKTRVFAAFVDLHSYSQEILYPFSYTCDRKPKNLEDLEEIAIGLAKAFRLTSGHHYGVDSACEGSVMLTTPSKTGKQDKVRTKVEESGGSALDFFYQELSVNYAFQIKLRDTGSHGFLLPKSNIVPTGIEAFNGLMGLGKWLLGNRGIEGYKDLSSDDIWGQEEVIINDVSDLNDSNNDNDVEEDEGTWWRRRRR